MAKAMKFWPLLSALVMLVFAVGVASNTVAGVEKKIDKESERNDIQDKQIAALEQIASEMPVIKQDIKEILRRLPK